VDLIHDEVLVDEVAKRCTEVESGARNVDNILTNTLLPEISRLILEKLVEGEMPAVIRVGVGQDGSFEYSTMERPAEPSRDAPLAPATV
jgi:type VI secretion system protein VasG